MNLKILYENPLLKMLSLLVFFDSFILVFIGVGVKAGMGIMYGTACGIAGGLVAMVVFNVISAALVMVYTG